MRRSSILARGNPRLLYLSLDATAPGQAGWADVDEVVDRLRARGWTVDLHQPAYVGKQPPGGVGRLIEMMRLQVPMILRLRGYDALYIRSHVLAFPLSLAARLVRMPVVRESNGGPDDLFIAWPQVRPFKRPLHSMARSQLRWADEVITVTPQLGKWLESESGHRRVTVVPNGANVDLFTPEATSPRNLPARYAVFFGSLAPWQGIVTMIAATAHIDWPTDVSLVVVGGGALREEVEHAAKAGRVVYLGSCPQSELPGIVAGSIGSLIVKDHPAHVTSGLSPLKLYESMAAGVPVVVSAMPGLEDTVERFECGLVVPPGDDGALARAVAQLSSDDEARARLGRNGRNAAVAEFSWETATDATERVIRRAIARHA